jgi:N-methylhydantoinase B/oxoprolinase/acetone carboxylase alpha subunit
MSVETTDLDPITFEVLRSGFEHAADRMSTVLQRASFSPIIYDSVDFSNAVFDPEGQLVGQTANCPVHLAAMHFSVEACLDEFGYDDIEAGDVMVLNDPYQGGTHINDITFTRPVYDDDDELLGFAVSRGHWTDLGGGAPGGTAWGTHLAEEGLRIPPTKVVAAGERNEDLVTLLTKNTRTPQYILGDLQAHEAALAAARDELHRLAGKYGPDVVRQGMADVLDYTERRTRRAIEDIPDGTYVATEYGDCDGVSDESVHVEVTLRVDGDRIEVDFAGTDDEARGAINSPKANTYSAVYYGLKFFTDNDAPANAGMYRAIDIDLPERTWVNPEWPRPTYGCTVFAAPKICAAIWEALAGAIPERIVAPTYADCNAFDFQIADPETGEVHVVADLPPGGWGGTPFDDGMETTMDPLGNCMDLPVERAERLFPLRVDRHEFLPNTGGPGEHRGGLGMVRTMTFHGHTELGVETARTKEGTPGVNGGDAGSLGRLFRNRGTDEEAVIGGYDDDGEWHRCIRSNEPFEPGESFTMETQGGGGWGTPEERDPEAVLADVRDGKVTADLAREAYGVVVDGGEVDAEATAALRAERRDE